jgi:hypothetical protein
VNARARAVAVVALLALSWIARARPALAHLMPAGQGTLNVVGDAVFAVLSVPVSALHGFDDDGDGLLSAPELDRHRAELSAEIDRRFALSDREVPGTTARVDLVLSPDHEASPDRAAQVVVLKHARFAGPVTDLRLRCDLFGERSDDRALAIAATRHPSSGPEAERAVLSAASPSHRFFPSPGSKLIDAIRGGADRVRFGAPHVALLLLVILGGAAGVIARKPRHRGAGDRSLRRRAERPAPE